MKEIKIDICDNTGVSLTLTVLFICATTISLGGCHMMEETQRQAIKSGLVQKQQQAPGVVVWTKP